MTSLVCLVSAASSGFGKSIALEALSRGHKVIATARQSSKIADLEEKGATVLDLDVTKSLEELINIVDRAQQVHGRLDILVNAAGYILEGAIEEASPQETFDTFNTNVFGVLNLTRAVLPIMRAQNSGAIALFGSVGSWGGAPAAGLYCATKRCISAFAESLRPEVVRFGIDVVAIELGYFRTGFLSSGAKISTQNQMKEYNETAAGQLRAYFAPTDNKQPGDVVRGSKVIVDVLTKVDGREIPLRLVLGSDALKTIRKKSQDTIALLQEWEDVARSTDYPEGQ